MLMPLKCIKFIISDDNMLMCLQLFFCSLDKVGKKENAHFYYRYTISNIRKNVEICVIFRIVYLWGFVSYRTKT